MLDLLLDSPRTARLPTPLAHAAGLIEQETRNCGEHTTADEVVGAIEALFSLVGRLWVAEYLAAGAPDEPANRMLYDRVVASGGRVLGGTWLGIGRTLRTVFLDRGLRPVAKGLTDLDFGRHGDDANAVARLSAYRNSFAHGSFQSVVGDIRAHRELLSSVIARLPFLDEQPFLMATGDGTVALRGEAERVVLHGPQAAAVLPELHPCLLGEDGRVVDLWPLAVGRDEKGAIGLAWPGKKDPGPKQLVKHESFVAWFARFQRELDGHVESSATCLGAPAAWPEATDELQVAIGTRREGLVLLETAPGAPRAGVLAAWADGATLRWRVAPHDLMGSGLVLVKALLRASERVLGLADGTLSCKEPEAWRTALQDAAGRLRAGGSVVRVAIEDLHRGDAPARVGEPSVQDVWRALAGGPFLAVAGVVRQWSLRPLPWDSRACLGWADTTDFRAVADFLAERAGSTLHREVLAALEASGAEVDLFEVCNAVEAARGEGSVFEPAVERALWDIAPVLLLGRASRAREELTETVRTFALLDTSVVYAALELA